MFTLNSNSKQGTKLLFIFRFFFLKKFIDENIYITADFWFFFFGTISTVRFKTSVTHEYAQPMAGPVDCWSSINVSRVNVLCKLRMVACFILD